MIDTIPPNITKTNISEINSYTVNMSELFNFSDLNLETCYVKVEGNKIGCKDNYTFQYNGNQSIYVYVNDTAGNHKSINFTLFVNPYQYFYFKEPNGSLIHNFTFNKEYYKDYVRLKTYNIGLGSHTFTFEKFGYQNTNITVNITNTSHINLISTIKISLLYIYFYNRDSHNLITKKIDFDLIGKNYSSNYSTTIGKKTITDIRYLPGNYLISTSAEGYSENEYYFQHTGYSAVNISIYLVNSSKTIPIKFVLKDIYQNPKPNCIIKIKQYFLKPNDYIVVDMGKTNSLGEAIFDLELDKYYQFVIDCNGKIQTEPGQKITSTPIYLTFNPKSNLNVFENLPNIRYNITWNNISNKTGYIRFEYDDANNIVSEGCLYVYKEGFNSEELISKKCQNSPSATIYNYINYSKTDKYIAKGYVIYNNHEYFVIEKVIDYTMNPHTWTQGIGLYLTILIVGILFLIGSALHPFAAIAFSWLGLVIMNLLGAILLSQSLLFGLGIFSIGLIIFKGGNNS